MSEQTRTLLVELDSLLDTRLATLHCLDPMLAKRVFDSPAYYTRDWDDWPTLTDGVVSLDEFNEAYSKRDKETLKVAKPTKMIQLLKNITTFLDEQRHTAPDVDGVHVIVNVDPYPLTKGARQVIATLVYHYCHHMTKVTTTRRTYDHLTPLAIKNQWDAVILYDFDRWFTLHGDALNQVLIPRHQLIVPRRYRISPDPLKEEYEEEVKEHYPFEMMEWACVERIDLTMLPLEEFTILKNLQ